ncbi:hypothetical protein Taro_010198 [Colocasia esculenta]|uniref:Uncharacterized protein n=1 Tax=Colocasia esculenta TaxID=4460 RepID=A0A843UCA5_COLES|nr:hypothetical protein [Colocasia esculenta]
MSPRPLRLPVCPHFLHSRPSPLPGTTPAVPAGDLRAPLRCDSWPLPFSHAHVHTQRGTFVLLQHPPGATNLVSTVTLSSQQSGCAIHTHRPPASSSTLSPFGGGLSSSLSGGDWGE